LKRCRTVDVDHRVAGRPVLPAARDGHFQLSLAITPTYGWISKTDREHCPERPHGDGWSIGRESRAGVRLHVPDGALISTTQCRSQRASESGRSDDGHAAAVMTRGAPLRITIVCSS